MKKTIWLLFDNRMGSVNAIKGVVQNLPADGFDIVEKQINYNFLAKLPNWIKGASLLGVTSESQKNLVPPFPDLVIAASRRTAPVALWIKKKSGGKTKTVQILHPGPGVRLCDFDAIFVPEHDKNKEYCSNMVYTIGSPTRTNLQTMKEAQKRWEKVFEYLPRPWTMVIVGGAVKGKPLSMDNAEGFAKEVINLKKEIGGSILSTDSRRTGEKARNKIMSLLKDIPAYTFLWGEKKENPYMGYLACADNILVSGDSVSMTCDACGTGKPVYIYCGHNWLTPKQYRFVKSLYDNGYAVSCLDGDKNKFKGGKCLNVAAEVAKKIETMLK